MIGLTSGLIWYFIKKVGFLLKKRSFCRFTKKRRVKVKWGSNGDTSVVSWTKWPQIENIPNIRTGDDTQRKWTVFSTHKSHQKSTVTSKGCPSTYVVVSEVFLVNWQKLLFFNKKLNFYIEYQKKRLVKPIICQNLRSFGQETTEISPFDPLVHSNEKR